MVVLFGTDKTVTKMVRSAVGLDAFIVEQGLTFNEIITRMLITLVARISLKIIRFRLLLLSPEIQHNIESSDVE